MNLLFDHPPSKEGRYYAPLSAIRVTNLFIREASTCVPNAYRASGNSRCFFYNLGVCGINSSAMDRTGSSASRAGIQLRIEINIPSMVLHVPCRPVAWKKAMDE